ncbi:MAG: DNA cytosine methyltransferase [Candidatus Tectomicrobia bacterium]|nr:DNA cytosine methyltransferase [Candidatus Tectomicrobia bacterium]
MSGKPWQTAIDLFSGAGSATAALKVAHFRILAAVDNDPAACATYRLNHPNVPIFEQDIRKLDPARLKRECLHGEDLDLIVICAPCQPFSSQNRCRLGDQRSNLLVDAARFVSELRPKVVFVENVPGLAAERHYYLLDAFEAACGPDYTFTKPLRIDAADYAVPQRRVRCVLMASRGPRPPSLPNAITPAGKRRTVRDSIACLPKLAASESDPTDPLHAARRHQSIALKRLRAIPKDGGSRSSLPESLALRCHKKPNSYPDVYGRMAWDEVAPTLTTGCTDVTRGRFAHPDQDRAITPREAALIQTFPRQYSFTGGSGVVATQIGNALPFALMRALAPALRTAIQAVP